jgi:hypothetical protein
MESQFVALAPYENFVFALKAKESKRQYPNRLNKFFTFIGLQVTIEERCVQLFELSKNDLNLLQSHLIRFINSQKERIVKNEIAEDDVINATRRNPVRGVFNSPDRDSIGDFDAFLIEGHRIKVIRKTAR